jgi:hypothetical protein
MGCKGLKFGCVSEVGSFLPRVELSRATTFTYFVNVRGSFHVNFPNVRLGGGDTYDAHEVDKM